MIRPGLLALICLAAGVAHAQPSILPAAGMTITTSTVVRPGVYQTRPAGQDSAVIVVRGNDITLDLANVQLAGASESDAPDQMSGVAILVDGGRNVTIRNGRIRGYKIAILARGTHNLRLLDNDLSFNWKPRLYSIVEHESLADWLSFHQNEKDEWMRFGAAIYLRDVKGGEIKGNTINQGMNGLLLTRSDSLLVWNNDFSFNSGLGIGLYRSDHNRIMHNRVDYNVRGYSEGFYRRGQDSAGILIYQQSDSNVVAFNSATHGGDGLFLWAGQHTMDTGQGGANDNVFYQNDFSWAPTNAMEATFSRNVFVGNRAVGSDYGLWGGYSYSSLVSGNVFERNRIGLAIEHGQENTIRGNLFINDSTDIWLWANRIEPGDWGYPKHRDTRSRDYWIENNTMSGGRVAFRFADTRDVTLTRNTVQADSVMVARGDTNGIQVVDTTRRADADIRIAPLANAKIVLPSSYANWPRSTIIVDDWGPYDWRSPKLWPVDSGLATPLRLRVLAPRGPGRWRLLRATGATLSKREGNVGDTIVVMPLPGATEDWTISLEYRGRETRSPRGVIARAGEPVVFGYSRFDPKANWEVKVYAWTDSTHPVTASDAFRSLLRGERAAAALSQSTARLDYMWYRPRIAGWPQEKAGVVATTTVDLPRGNYALHAISDDGIRVYVDDELVIDDWSVHESRVREAPIGAGRRRIRVEYFQGDGWAELQVAIVRR